MSSPSRRRLLATFAVLAVALGLAVFVAFAGHEKTARQGDPSHPDGVVGRPETAATPPPFRIGKPLPAVPAAVVAPPILRAAWGAGDGQLGHSRPQEGNPEAPMSFVATPDGTVVLDQVNGRVVRFGPDRKPVSSFPSPVQAAQDLAVAKDGTTVVLDRLADKTVAVVGPDGKLLGELPLEGAGLTEGGASTGVVVDGDDVYVEREHGPLVRVGNVRGGVDEQRTEIPGRPSRDGRAFLNAGITDAATGRLRLTVVDRPSLEHRFTREYRIAARTPAIVLLDSDDAGKIYLGAVTLEGEGATPNVLVLVLDGSRGEVMDRAVFPANTDADETFRELSVRPDGSIIQAVRDETGFSLVPRPPSR